MVNKYIVECPHCKMRFFVTDVLLGAANGSLRCGFCLHIFHGPECIVDENMGHVISTKPLSDDVDSKQDEHVTTVSCDETQVEEDRNSYSENYWQDVIKTFSQLSTTSSRANKPFNYIGTQQVKEGILSNELLSAYSHGNKYADTSITVDDDIVSYLDGINLDHCLQVDEGRLVIEHNKKVDRYLKEVEEGVAASKALTSEDSCIVKDIYGNKLKVITDVDFDHYVAPKKLINKVNFIWGLLSVLGLLFLVAQYLHFAVPKMAKNMADRSWAEQVCKYVLCQLPVQIDVDKIATEKLLVRADPEHEGVLSVDSIIYNTASFSQPYPIIELRFTNLNGQVVASRRFLPKEYLADKILEQNQMPSNMPVYISFQIIDPGEDAVGRSLHYYPDYPADTF